MQLLSPLDDDVPAEFLVDDGRQSLVNLAAQLVGEQFLHALDFGEAIEDESQVVFFPLEILSVAIVPLKAAQHLRFPVHFELRIQQSDFELVGRGTVQGGEAVEQQAVPRLLPDELFASLHFNFVI